MYDSLRPPERRRVEDALPGLRSFRGSEMLRNDLVQEVQQKWGADDDYVLRLLIDLHGQSGLWGRPIESYGSITIHRKA